MAKRCVFRRRLKVLRCSDVGLQSVLGAATKNLLALLSAHPAEGLLQGTSLAVHLYSV